MEIDAVRLSGAIRLVQRSIRNRAEHIEKQALAAMANNIEARSLLGQSTGLHHAADEIKIMIQLLYPDQPIEQDHR